jgi:hypothetical protein
VIGSSVLIVALGLGGCNLNKFTATTTAKMLVEGSKAMDAESDMTFAGEAFPASLKTLETFLYSAPEDPHLLLLLARGYNSYAFGFLETELDEARFTGPAARVDTLSRRAKLHYLRGSEYGFRLLARPDVHDAAVANDMAALSRALEGVEVEDAPALFWATYGWASAINLGQDDPDRVAYLTVVETMMRRVYELDPDYNGGAPIVFFGVLEASKPKAFGGRPDVAKKYFDEAMARHGETNLLVPFLYARFYCPTVQDRKLFEELLVGVEEADVTRVPEMRLNNEIARHRARMWKEHVKELFLE